MKNIIIAIIIILSSCTSRSTTKMDETRLESLKRMRINNSSDVFYDYSYSGLMAWSSSITGCVLIDSTEAFSWQKIQNKFPYGYITNIDLNSNQICMIEFITDSSEVIDNGIYTRKFDNIDIVLKQYFNTKGSTMGFSYHFYNLSENSDSIFFDRIYREDYDFGLDFKGKVGFRKGNVYVEEDSLGYVSKIKLSLINQNPLWKDLQKKESISISKSFNGINEINLPPLSNVYIFNLELRPDSLSKRQKISDFGIYKKVR